MNSNRKNTNIFCLPFSILALLTLFVFCVNGCGSVRSSASSSSSMPSLKQRPPRDIPTQKPYVVMGQRYSPIDNSKGFQQKGIASWYGKDFHGRKTANGEVYNMHAMTAAHKTLPINSKIRVRNLKNNKAIDVRVNDRGPFVRGRIVDLSYKAAKKLDIVDSGIAPVEIVALKSPSLKPNERRIPNIALRGNAQGNYEIGNFTIQVGAFRNRINAEELYRKLNRSYNNAHISDFNNGVDSFYRVRIGKCSTLSKAAEYERILIERGFKGAFIVAE